MNVQNSSAADVENHAPDNMCDLCGKKCSTASNMNTHMKLVHTEEALKKFECSLCGKKYARRCDLRFHSESHSIQPKGIFKCTFCQICFKTRKAVKIHEKGHIEKKFKCTFCIYKSERKDALVSHVRRHTKEMPFDCKRCNKSFKQRTTLSLHMRYHNGERPYQCPYCIWFKRFTQSTHLLTHKRSIHLFEKGRKTFVCVICNKTLNSKQALNTHMVIHSDKSAFKCELCPKSFKLKQHFKIHFTTQHTLSDEEFKCKMCSKVLTQARTLAKHIKEVHESAHASMWCLWLQGCPQVYYKNSHWCSP